MSNLKKSPWSYIGISDRETMINGLLGWLMDPNGTHELKGNFLKKILSDFGIEADKNFENYEIETEAKKKNRRFDLLIKHHKKDLLALEVKCKTFGGKGQLEKYSNSGIKIGRIAYGEWNFPDLKEEQRHKFPLVSFETIAKHIESLTQYDVKFKDFLQSLKEHIEDESNAFKELNNYYLKENSDIPPKENAKYTLGDRFVNQLFWKWVLETNNFPGWHFDSQTTGVWFAGSKNVVKEKEKLVNNYLGLNIPGPVHIWIQIELNGTLLGNADEDVGKIQLRIRGESDQNHRLKIYNQVIKGEKEVLENEGFILPNKKPSKSNNYYSAFTKKLKRKDFKLSSLKDLVYNKLEFKPS